MLESEDGRDPGLANFYGEHYQRHNEARLAHLDSLNLPLRNRTVLEVGSGPGHHTGFYLAKGCRVTATDARPQCVTEIAEHFPTVRTAVVDMNTPDDLVPLGSFEIVHCYGLLYHLERPEAALSALAAACEDLLLLETCVTPGAGLAINLVTEVSSDYTQSITATGCRPTRAWIFSQLQKLFPYVYNTRTQPDHF